MRHLKAGRTLGRNAAHRRAMLRNLARSLIEHGRIITTVAKAKEVRPFVEKLITLAKKGTLHARRLVRARLGSVATADLLDKENKFTGDTVLEKLFKEIAPRFADRPGGYTRVVKRHERRLGDAGKTAFLELLKEGETKVRARAPAPPPAPEVRAPEPEPEPPPEAPAETTPGGAAPEATGETPPAENPPAST